MIMNKQLVLSFLPLLFLFSACSDDDLPDASLEREGFKRHENLNFNRENTNVKNIQRIGDRLFYSHRTNPGFIDQDGEVHQLCCLSYNHMDMNQTFSEKFIVSAGHDLRGFRVYVADDRSFGEYGSISFPELDVHSEENILIHFDRERNNFALNGDHLIASVYSLDNNFLSAPDIFIYDLEKHTNFFGTPESSEGVIKLDFSAFLDLPDAQGARIGHASAFEDGWIISVFFQQTWRHGTFFVKKDGALSQLVLFNQQNSEQFFYTGHTFLDNGQLFVISNGKTLLHSETGQLADLKKVGVLNQRYTPYSIGNRLVLTVLRSDIFLEVEGILDREPVEWEFRRLDDTNIAFSSINAIAKFRDKVYVATSIGLFTKSEEAFWDSYVEKDNDQEDISEHWPAPQFSIE